MKAMWEELASLMETDGFDYPEEGDLTEVWLAKVINYIKHLRARCQTNLN